MAMNTNNTNNKMEKQPKTWIGNPTDYGATSKTEDRECRCECHNPGIMYIEPPKHCPSCMSSPKPEWEERFDKLVYKYNRDSLWADEVKPKDRLSLFSITSDMQNEIKSFIRNLIQEERKQERLEIRQHFVKLAIDGVTDKDELKGVSLYTRMLNYLDELEEE